MPVNTIASGDKKIVVVDCSNLGANNKAEIRKTLEEGNKTIAACGAKSALVITNVTNLSFDGEVFEAFKTYASKNTPYVKASSLVGLSGLQKIMFNTIKVLTGRDYYIASNFDDAKTYLLKK